MNESTNYTYIIFVKALGYENVEKFARTFPHFVTGNAIIPEINFPNWFAILFHNFHASLNDSNIVVFWLHFEARAPDDEEKREEFLVRERKKNKQTKGKSVNIKGQ